MATGLSRIGGSSTSMSGSYEVFQNPLNREPLVTVHHLEDSPVRAAGSVQGAEKHLEIQNRQQTAVRPENSLQGHTGVSAGGHQSRTGLDALNREAAQATGSAFHNFGAQDGTVYRNTPRGQLVANSRATVGQQDAHNDDLSSIHQSFISSNEPIHGLESVFGRESGGEDGRQQSSANGTSLSGTATSPDEDDESSSRVSGNTSDYDIEASRSPESRDALIQDNGIRSDGFGELASGAAATQETEPPPSSPRWDQRRCHQRLLALGLILVVAVLAALTTLQFLLPDLNVKLPPRVCLRVADEIYIRPNFTEVAWEGFGTSLAWWAGWAGGLPEEHRNAILDDLFSLEKGLGLKVARYNIGGGGGAAEDSAFSSPPYSYRVVPGFKSNATAPYDWSQDLNQRTILFGARGRGANVFEAASYSPPAWMTVSGSFTGADVFKADNLDPSNYGAFAAYLADVVKAYRDLWGFEFRVLAPVNEPVEGWWVSGGFQEGCNFASESLDDFLPFVKQALMQRNLQTEVAAFDSWASNTPRAYAKFSSLTRSVISRLNVHSYQPLNGLSYSASLKFREDMASLAKAEKKVVHMSEWGPQFLEGTDLDVALIMGRTIALDINVLKVGSWSYWQAIEVYEGVPYWGLIEAKSRSPDSFSRVNRKQYYVLGQFSKWVAQGSRIIHTDASCNAGLVAAYHHQLQRLVLVVINEYTEELHRVFNFVKFVSVDETAKVDIYRTSANENHDYVGSVQNLYVPGYFSRSIAPKSATTYIISGVTLAGSGSSGGEVQVAQGRQLWLGTSGD